MFGTNLLEEEDNWRDSRTHKSTKLLRTLQHTRNDKRPPIPSYPHQLRKVLLHPLHLRSPPLLHRPYLAPTHNNILLFHDIPLHPPKHTIHKPLRIHPLAPLIHLHQHPPSLLLLPRLRQIPRRLRHTKEKHNELHERRQCTNTNHPPPPMRLLRKPPPDNIRHDLSARNKQTRNSNHATSPRPRRQLPNIQRNDKRCASNRRPDDAPPCNHTPHTARPRLPQRADDEEHIRG